MMRLPLRSMSNACVKACRAIVAVLFLIGLLTNIAKGAPPVRQRAVDVLILQDGTQLLGVMIPDQVSTPGQKPPDEYVRFLLRRKWATEHIPDLLNVATTIKVEQQSPGLAALLRDHIDALKGQGVEDDRRIAFLEERLDIVQRRDQRQQSEPEGCVVLQVQKRLIRNRLAQNREKRSLSSLASVNDVDGFEEMSQEDLAAKLAGIPASELRKQLPGSDADVAKTRFQSLQLAADNLFGRKTRLIRFKDRFVDESAGQEQILQLIPELLTGQIQSQLQDLLAEPGTRRVVAKPDMTGPLAEIPDAARKAAEADDVRLIVISGMAMDLSKGSATVEISLYHRVADTDSWRLAVYSRKSASTEDIPEEKQQQLRADPRIKEILSVFETLGSSNDQVGQALNMGAVVQVAQQAANREVQQHLLEAAQVTAPEPGLQVLNLDVLPKR